MVWARIELFRVGRLALLEVVRTMAAPALAAITAAKEKVSGEDHQPAFEVVVDAFFEARRVSIGLG